MEETSKYFFLLTEKGLPDYLNYEFRTDGGILYSVFFMQNEYQNEFTDTKFLAKGYEFGLQEVEETHKGNTRPMDYKIQRTVVSIIEDFLLQFEKNFLMTIQYSGAQNKAITRYKVFNRWYNNYKTNFPLKKYDKEIEIDGKAIYKSIIVHQENPNIDSILKEFSESI